METPHGIKRVKDRTEGDVEDTDLTKRDIQVKEEKKTRTVSTIEISLKRYS